MLSLAGCVRQSGRLLIVQDRKIFCTTSEGGAQRIGVGRGAGVGDDEGASGWGIGGLTG